MTRRPGRAKSASAATQAGRIARTKEGDWGRAGGPEGREVRGVTLSHRSASRLIPRFDRTWHDLSVARGGARQERSPDVMWPPCASPTRAYSGPSHFMISPLRRPWEPLASVAML